MYKLGLSEPEPDLPARPEPAGQPLVGTHGIIDVDVLMLKKDQQLVMVVDHEFLDIPSWVEWDKSRESVGIAQASGAVAEIKNAIPDKFKAELSGVNSLLLLTKFNGVKVAHTISLIVHD